MADLKPRQVKVAALLVTGRTARDVASELKITPETISIWKRNPDFQRLLVQLKAEAMVHCRDTIASAVVDAAQTLVRLVREGRSEEVRRRAALDVLDLAGIRDRAGALMTEASVEAELRRAEANTFADNQNWFLAQLRELQQKKMALCSEQPKTLLLGVSEPSCPFE
jgi:hypothetical protein